MPRALEVFTDSVTGEQRIFCALGNPGILSGVYDSTLPAKIRWDKNREIKGLAVRPLGMAVVNGVLWFSAGAQLYRRNDGQKPTYTVAVTMSNSSVNPDSGGIRVLRRPRIARFVSSLGCGCLLLRFATRQANATQYEALRPSIDRLPLTKDVGHYPFGGYR